MVIENPIFGFFAAFIGGALLAACGYLLSRRLLQKQPQYYAVGQAVKQLVQIGYVLGLYFLAEYTPWDGVWLLFGGCIGMTLPMLWFTYRLVKLNDTVDRKGDEHDG